jgi:hypothetical protein
VCVCRHGLGFLYQEREKKQAFIVVEKDFTSVEKTAKGIKG